MEQDLKMDQKKRCFWGENVPEDYTKYHDSVWGVPVREDAFLFEMLLLECFQAGLSWYTILKKQDGFKSAFSGFDVNAIARYDELDVERLMNCTDIIRNRNKINAAIKNANVFLEIQKEFESFSNYLWGFTDHKVVVNKTDSMPTQTPLAEEISKDLKKRGMKFIGPVTVYSYLQATGVVNDHSLTCFRRQEIIDEFDELSE